MATATQLRTRVNAHLNAWLLTLVTDYPTTSVGTAGREKLGFAPAKIDDAVTDAAAAINGIIASTPGHPRRSSLETATSITSGALLPAHIGEVGAVTIASKPGILTSPDAVQRLVTNALSLTLGVGYYGYDGERVYFTGTPATADLVTAATIADVTKVPEEFIEAVVAEAVMMCFMLGGDPEKAAAAAHYKSIADSYKQMIASNQAPPETPPYVP